MGLAAVCGGGLGSTRAKNYSSLWGLRFPPAAPTTLPQPWGLPIQKFTLTQPPHL